MMDSFSLDSCDMVCEGVSCKDFAHTSSAASLMIGLENTVALMIVTIKNPATRITEQPYLSTSPPSR